MDKFWDLLDSEKDWQPWCYTERQGAHFIIYNNFTFEKITPQSSDLCSLTSTFKYGFCLFWFRSISQKWKERYTFWNEEFFTCDFDFAPGYSNVLQLTDNTQVLQQILRDPLWMTVTNPSRVCQKWGTDKTQRWISGLAGHPTSQKLSATLIL